jgi:hypothetical protein
MGEKRNACEILVGEPEGNIGHYEDLDVGGRMPYKKFWEELTAYFPLIPQGLHRKRKKK